MCVVSMVADHYMEKWNGWINTPNGWPSVTIPFGDETDDYLPVSRAEYLALKNELEEMKKLLARAKEYDERTGQAECENGEKLKVLFAVADALGIDLAEVIERPE